MPRITFDHLRRAALLLTLPLVTGACYRYTPADPETAPPGQGVRVMMTRQGATELATVADVDQNAPTVSGTVVGVQDDDLLLQVAVGRRQEGFIGADLNQTVRVPRGEIITFERRELDKAATALVVGGAAALTAVLVTVIIDPFGWSDPAGVDPPDELLLRRINLFSIPVGR